MFATILNIVQIIVLVCIIVTNNWLAEMKRIEIDKLREQNRFLERHSHELMEINERLKRRLL